MPAHTHARGFFTAEVEAEILTRLSEGESLLRICGTNRRRGMPDRVSVHRRLREDAAFRRRYLLAREAQAVTLAEETLEIADGARPVEGEATPVGRDWLRVNARKWAAGVMAPRMFGPARFLRDELSDMEAEAKKERMGVLPAAARICAILEDAERRLLAGEPLPEGRDGEILRYWFGVDRMGEDEEEMEEEEEEEGEEGEEDNDER